ncbi:MAG: hypothetical protein HQM11_19115 [SAR324 cluster bacterium]|nr:hypothetical protein [SAR324 cluster bacterium]
MENNNLQPCNQTEILLKLEVESPQTVKNAFWAEHLLGCSICQHELRAFRRSLELYLRISEENANIVDSYQIWDQLEKKLPHNRFRSTTVAKVLMAASVLLLLGIPSWFSLQKQDPYAIPSQYTVIDMQTEETFGEKSGQTQLIWGTEKFGLMIRDANGTDSTIVIGMKLGTHFSLLNGTLFQNRELVSLKKSTPPTKGS